MYNSGFHISHQRFNKGWSWFASPLFFLWDAARFLHLRRDALFRRIREVRAVMSRPPRWMVCKQSNADLWLVLLGSVSWWGSSWEKSQLLEWLIRNLIQIPLEERRVQMHYLIPQVLWRQKWRYEESIDQFWGIHFLSAIQLMRTGCWCC